MPSDRQQRLWLHLPRGENRAVQPAAKARCSRWPCWGGLVARDPAGLVIENRAWCRVAGNRRGNSASRPLFLPFCLGANAAGAEGVQPRPEISASQGSLNGQVRPSRRQRARERSKADQGRQPCAAGQMQGVGKVRAHGDCHVQGIQHADQSCSRCTCGWPVQTFKARMTPRATSDSTTQQPIQLKRQP